MRRLHIILSLTGILGAACGDAIVATPDDAWTHDGGPTADAQVAISDSLSSPTDTTDTTPPTEPIAPTPKNGILLYPTQAIHSPITAEIGATLSQIAQSNVGTRKAVFSKFGDSITVANSYLNCFAGTNVEWDTHGALEDTRLFFQKETVSGTTSFDRDSLAALSGKTAKWAISGSPSRAELELAAIAPAYAIVMFGTNDIGYFPEDRAHTFDWYAEHLFDLVDHLVDFGTVPIMMTLPPLDLDDDRPYLVPAFNALIRSYAQHKQLPLVNYYQAMLGLTNLGLTGDGVHPNTHYASGSKPCVFTPEGLDHGYNMRNLISLQGLSRTKRAVEGEVLDSTDQNDYLQGEGTHSSPFRISSLPFGHVASTKESNQRLFSQYSGCNATQDESGPEVVYQFTTSQTVVVRAVVVDRNDVDIDLHLLEGSLAEASCRKRAHTLLTAQLAPGTHYFVLDSFAKDGTEYSGEYAFALIDCQGDPNCTP